jgi:hypothetical protein
VASDVTQLEPERTVRLGERVLRLPGRAPAIGSRLDATFRIPPARRTDTPLTRESLVRGLVVLSTLPNIEKHACVAQIVDLEEHGRCLVHQPRIVHVSSDAAVHWAEVDQFHPGVLSESYSLAGCDDDSRKSFTGAFGVAVEGERRITHGLFALLDGVFLAVDIPVDQMRAPWVAAFLDAVHGALHTRAAE